MEELPTKQNLEKDEPGGRKALESKKHYMRNKLNKKTPTGYNVAKQFMSTFSKEQEKMILIKW